MDVAAIRDFPGAMENWGLITFQEDGLLYQEGITDALQKENIIKVIILYENYPELVL
jgi:aminopeptidase N